MKLMHGREEAGPEGGFKREMTDYSPLDGFVQGGWTVALGQGGIAWVGSGVRAVHGRTTNAPLRCCLKGSARVREIFGRLVNKVL